MSRPANDARSVLITGGAGFVGLHMADVLLDAGWSVTSLDIAPPDDVAIAAAGRWEGRLRFVQGDVCDATVMQHALATSGARHVVHAAAITTQRRDNTLAMVDIHLRTTQMLLDLARDGELDRIIAVSSAAVFQSSEGVASLDEDYPPILDSPYAITKHAAERLIAYARRTDGTDAVSVRLPAIYGPYERPTGARTTMSMVHQAMHLARSGERLRSNVPDVVRDWTHGADVGQGIVRLLDHAGPLQPLYHLGIGRGYTLRETLDAVRQAVPGTIVEWVEREADANLPVSLGNIRAPLAIERATRDLGYAPAYPLETGVQDYATFLNR